MNTVNLLKLADFLENKITDEQFDMEKFRSQKNGSRVKFKSLHDCGTVGCALGWTPFINSIKPSYGTNEPVSLDPLFSDWDDYCSRVFGINMKKPYVIDHSPVYNHVWEFIFDSEWSRNPEENTRHATANRIRIACEGLIR